MKRMSRAKRLGIVCESIRSQTELLREVPESDVSEEDKVKLANEIIGKIGYEEIENLRDEIQEWKDNIEEKFSATQKYSYLEECVSSLDNAVTEFEGADEEISDTSEIEERVEKLNTGLDHCDEVSFPGMFG